MKEITGAGINASSAFCWSAATSVWPKTSEIHSGVARITVASSLSESRFASGYRPRTLFRRPLARVIQVSTVARTVVDNGPSTTLPSPCASPQTSPAVANTGGSTSPQTRQQTAAVRRTATRWGTAPCARRTHAIGR